MMSALEATEERRKSNADIKLKGSLNDHFKNKQEVMDIVPVITISFDENEDSLAISKSKSNIDDTQRVGSVK
jgi:hypothetical protein